MAARSSWGGHLRRSLVACPIPSSAVKPALNPAGRNIASLLQGRMPANPWADFAATAATTGSLRDAIAKVSRKS